MPSRFPHPRGQDGFTIIETMVASVLLLVGLAGTLTLVDTASSTTKTTYAREQGTNLQRELIEAGRSVPYDELRPNGVAASVRTRPALADASGSEAGWTIRRRGTTYTVSMGVCTADDPGDGNGAHDEPGVFCPPKPSPPPDCPALIKASEPGTPPGAGAGASAGLCGIDADLDGTVDGVANATATACQMSPCTDTNPADYKRIVSLVRWPGGYNLQISQVNNPGQAAAPAVTSLTAATNTVTTTTTSLGLTALTTNFPVTVGLYLDGTALAPGFSGSGNSWTGSWNLGSVTGPGGQPSASEVLDGSYQLSAKAFDQYGQYGATRSQTIVVDRRVAFAPAQVKAGRNGGPVEIEWSPPKERDSAGFRVDRRLRDADGSASGPTTVCARAAQTQCRDLTPPAPSASTFVEYSVVGYDTGPGEQPQPGDASPWRSVDPVGSPPESPGTLQATTSGDGVVLTWTAPSGPVTADHYNIYRDGQTYANRLDSVYLAPGQPLSYTTPTTGAEHDYWITAVNDQLGESPQLGPVRK